MEQLNEFKLNFLAKKKCKTNGLSIEEEQISTVFFIKYNPIIKFPIGYRKAVEAFKIDKFSFLEKEGEYNCIVSWQSRENDTTFYEMNIVFKRINFDLKIIDAY